MSFDEHLEPVLGASVTLDAVEMMVVLALLKKKDEKKDAFLASSPALARISCRLIERLEAASAPMSALCRAYMGESLDALFGPGA